MSATPEETPQPKKRGFFKTFLFIVVLGVIAALYLLPDEDDAAAPVANLTGQAFESAVNSGVHLVDFWAEWCGPCKIQAPIIEKVAKRYAGKVRVSKVDVDTEGDLAMQFGITGIPTLILFKNGKEVDRFVGVTEESALADAVRGIL